MTQAHPSADQFPPRPGAYGLLIRLQRPETVRIANRPPICLDPGFYVYCGSAKGPGGLRARLARHLKTSKALHWHVDQLTTTGDIMGVWTSETTAECQLVDAINKTNGVDSPLPGFGSSDCRSCVSHLVAIPGDIEAANLFAALGPGITWLAQPRVQSQVR